MNITIRETLQDDASECGIICLEAFNAIADQHNFPHDFGSVEETSGLLSHLFSRNDIYTIVAEVNDKILGSNVLWENGKVAGVGPITVEPNIQGSQVGKVLMENILERAESKGFKSVRLVQAAYNNTTMALYTKLGFDVQEPLSTLNGDAINITIPGYNVRLAELGDLETCNVLCRKIHGFDRSGDLSGAIDQNTATVVERDGNITAYSTMIGFFGHTIGETNRDLQALIGAAQAFAGPGILVPTRNAELLRWCLSHGLRIIQPMSLMSRGEYQTPKGSFLPSVIF
jgi:ribosomal protein S18 acetylase RimI-like enzyme